MGVSKTRELPAGMEAVRRRFEHWRRTHKARSRIPDSLWAAAVRLVGRCGLHRTSRALRLDYYSLKERAEHGSAAAVDFDESFATPAFVELSPAPTVGRCECTVELENAGGAKMRVHLEGVAMPDLAALSRSFWNPAP
jgi:hypothetical protein